MSSDVILTELAPSGFTGFLDAFLHRTNGPARVPRYPDPPGSWGPSTGPRSLFSIVNDWGASFFVVSSVGVGGLGLSSSLRGRRLCALRA